MCSLQIKSVGSLCDKREKTAIYYKKLYQNISIFFVYKLYVTQENRNNIYISYQIY